MGVQLVATSTLVRRGGVWSAQSLDEDSLPLAVYSEADQVRGAGKEVKWVLRRGFTHDIPADIADELRAAGVGTGKLGGVLRTVADPVPWQPRVVEPAYDAARARTEIVALDAKVDGKFAALDAKLDAVLEALRVPPATTGPVNG